MVCRFLSSFLEVLDSVFLLSKHFLMLNAHKYDKINAHGVVMLLVRLSKDSTPILFKPSFTFTLFNFLVHRCKKADARIRLTGLGSTDNIVYPRHIKNQERYGSLSTETYVCDTFPSVEGI